LRGFLLSEAQRQTARAEGCEPGCEHRVRVRSEGYLLPRSLVICSWPAGAAGKPT